jgi:hypothetical protein
MVFISLLKVLLLYLSIKLPIMKNILLIACLLIVNTTFSQKDSNPFTEKIFYNNIEENHYRENNFNPFELKKIDLIKSIKPSNNSEGKFPFYNNNPVLLNLENQNESESIVHHIKARTNNNPFIDRLVLKILQDENIKISDFKNSIDFNGDKNISFYKNYTVDVNKLIVAYRLHKDLEIQLGKDIFRSIRKINKSELDITLFNHLNLLVFNF